VIVAPSLDGTDIGEVYSAFQLVKALSEQTDVTVLASSRPGRKPLAEQLPDARVLTWPEPAFLIRHFERLNAALKPALPIFFRQARNWIRQALRKGEGIDIAHQIVPQAMRYACPLRGLGIPYVVGPLGGALTTPEAFRAEVGSAKLITRLRAVDRFRLRFDPWLRAGYAEADLVLGVAPYVAEILSPVPIRRFEVALERANDGLAPEVQRQAGEGRLHLLHVGRAVRTKGLRDVVRALAHLSDLPGVTLTSAGGGEEIELCRAEAERLGVADRVNFLGMIPREDVETLYEQADVFAFPSFREPMGGVLFEALRWGLPVIAAARGGPDYIIDDSCGIRVPVSDPARFPVDIAAAARRLALEPEFRQRLGQGAHARIVGFGSWDEKATRMIALYVSAIEAFRSRTGPEGKGGG